MGLLDNNGRRRLGNGLHVPEQKLPKKNKGFQISAKRNPTKIY